MEITVNGETKRAEDGATVRGLLESLGVPAENAVVSLNGEVLPLEELDARRLSEGDSVELFAFVGGG